MSEVLAAPPRRNPFRTVAATYRAAFAGLPRPVWLLCAVTLVNRSGTMVIPFLALYLTERRGFTAQGAGALLGLYGVGAIAGAYLGGWLSDRIDVRHVMGGSLVLGGLGFFVLGILRGRLAIAAALLFLSIVGEAFRPAVSAAMVRAAPPAVRTRAYALLRLAVNLGMMIGPVVAGFLAQVSYSWLFLGDGGTCIAAAALLWARFGAAGAPPAAAAERQHADGGSPWRDRPFLASVLLSTLLSIVFFQILSTYPLTLRTLYNFSEALVGVTFGVNTAIIVAVEMVLVHLLRGLRPLRVVAVGAVLIGAGFGLLPVGVRGGFAFVLFTVVLWTAGEMFAFPFIQGFAGDRAHGRAEGRYMGLSSLAFAIAFAVAPVLGTWIYQHHGVDAVWRACGVAGVALWGAFELLDRRLRRAVRPAAG